jgi:hypothetical protein
LRPKPDGLYRRHYGTQFGIAAFIDFSDVFH